MGVASPTPRPPSLAREPLTSSKLISATPSMSQGFHQGSSIFSFSDEFQERPPQQHHLTQQSRRNKLRPVQGFEDSTAVAALSITGNPLQAPMEEEEDEEEEMAGIYGTATTTPSTNNILSEMFNFPGAPADLLTCQNSPPAGYHRLQQRPAASFLGATDGWPYAGNRQGLVMNNTANWGSLEDAEAAAAAAAVGKPHGDMNSDSSTAMRLFFMNPESAGAPVAQSARQHQQREHHRRPPNSPPEDEPDIGAAAAVAAAVAPLHHPQSSHHNQAFLGAGGAAYGFSGGGGSVMETQGLSLSLSSSLRQFEIMSKSDQELSSVREAEAGTLFFDSQLHHHEQAEQHDHHELLAAGHHLQIIRQGQQQQQQQVHMVMSYGGGGNGGPGPVGTAGVMNVLRNSKYARVVQELLEEFCNVGRSGQFQLRSGNRTARASSSNPNTSSSHAGAGGAASTSAAAAATVSSSSSKDIPLPLSPADRFENQRKKSKLLSILEEVERRYNHYCEQMQMVVNSFDSVMGVGAATPYTALARKAMSRHFRCLKDAVAAQLRQTCELLGENDGAGSGSGLTKGETPRLRLIDQSLRQQRAFHQLGMMEQEAWRPQRGLPDRSVNVLRAWLFEHFLHPYPSDADKHLLARQTGLSRNQVSNWFINARVRLWKPMVEDMYQQESKEVEDGVEEDLQHNKLEEETANSRTLAAVTTTQQQQQQQQQQAHQTRQQSSESHTLPENDPSSALIPRSQPQQADDSAADVIFPPALDERMYGRAAAALGTSSAAQVRFGGAAAAASASASARGSGDLSLTLGLRHAGGNAPETGRFGV